MICSRVYLLFDYVGRSGSAILEWLDCERVTKRDRGQLDQKLDMLRSHGMELCPRLLAGPIGSRTKPLNSKHIYKLKIHGTIMLRPFLCRGPINNDYEFTLLMGAIERGGKLDHDPAEAEVIRREIISTPNRRMYHERYA